jgi:hypothetical protein
MPLCSHCNRNVSRKTELLHRKYGARPRLTADAVAAFRKSAKLPKARVTCSKIRASSPTSEADVSMDGGPSIQQSDHNFAMDTDKVNPRLDESRDAIVEIAMSNARTRLWPEGTRPYAARVDDYESDEEDIEENSGDGSCVVDDWSFDYDDDIIDLTEYADELSAWDQLGEEFEREANENSELVPRPLRLCQC